MKRGARWSKAAWAAVAAACLYTMVPGRAATAGKTSAQWQALARADLEAARAAVIAAHPGYIDDRNPGFRIWAEQGYREALALVPRVDSYDGMMAATRYYVTGFRDGHFVYSDDARSGDYPVRSSGWMLDKAGDAYVVVGHNPEWQGDLPPLDARLLGCDGRTPQAIIDADVAPYFERRGLPEFQGGLAEMLAYPPLAGMGLKTCAFEQAGGRRLTYAVSYRNVSSASMFKTRARPVAWPERSNDYTFEDGVLWIRAQNFMPDPQQMRALDAMLEKIAALQGVRTIVFDTRGNGGGSSAIGDRIFKAATGGLEFDKGGLDRLPRFHAQWRVSEVGLQAMERYVDTVRKRYGERAEETRDMIKRRDAMRAARQSGRDWIEQPVGPRLARADIAQRGGHMLRFNGTVAVVADNACASACLDFLDEVRLVPTSIQLGQTTSSDTLYLEAGGRVTLPSGNHLVMPLKVWRNRVRGDSEPLVPDIPLDVDMRDDAAVRAATLRALPAVPQAPSREAGTM